ncbi:MAG: ArsR family transcriptional regulator [Thermoplasmata archaeon]|nr:ArsR family transcriptional regulator [Thermoplasmata archaeon]
MSDVGYSSRFEIYLTKNNGVQIITNELSLSILRELRHREISPSDISASFGLPKSTIQASIIKLLRLGIISSETCISDARSVVYHIDASIIFCSDTDVEWQMYARDASTARIMKVGRCTSREDLALYGVSITESGLNIVQGLFEIGAALTSGDLNKAWWDRTLSAMKSECERYDIVMDMVTKDGLELRFDSLYENISDVPLIIVPMLGSIISHSKELLGYRLSHDVSLKVTNSGRSVIMRIAPFVGQDFVSDNGYRLKRNISDYRIEEPFSIYSINGQAMLFMNPTMIGILNSLSYQRMTVNELGDRMDVSKATIYASLMKLIDMGAVGVDKSRGSSKKYELLADPMLYCTPVSTSDCRGIESVVEKFQNGELDYYSAVIAYAMKVIDCMGVHFEKMFIRSGCSTARSVLKMNPDVEPEELLTVACNMVSEPDCAEVVTKIPLKIRVTMSPNTLWDTWPGDFVKGFVAEGLKELTGEDYKIEIDTVFEGKKRQQAHGLRPNQE